MRQRVHEFTAQAVTYTALDVTMTDVSRGSTRVARRPDPGSRRGRLELAVAPSAVRVARRWIADQLAQTEPPPGDDLIDTAVLVISELATNAILAVQESAAQPGALVSGQARVALVICRVRDVVRLEVHDSACVPLPPVRHSDDDDETGRGLVVVATLAERWGWQPTASGKVVWCELALRQSIP
jgi:serine/threonine-protein kinase RsbW